MNLFLTKEALYRLSYVGVMFAFGGGSSRSRRFQNKRVERETSLELATFSLEG